MGATGKRAWVGGVVLLVVLGLWLVLRDGGARGVDPADAQTAELVQEPASSEVRALSEPTRAAREGVASEPEPEPAPELRPGVEATAPATSAAAGFRVSGFVRDPDGIPYAGATLFVSTPGSASWSSRKERSAEDGSFVLTGIEPGTWRIGASADEAVDTVFVELEVQEDVEGLELVLPRGGCISGTVVWADGEPAAKVVVSAFQAARAIGTQLDGASFELCGLPDVPHVVEARAEREGKKAVARAEDVRPGAAALRLVLVPELTFDVQLDVRDASGAPVPDVKASAFVLDGSFREVAGGSTLSGLTAGRWEIALEAPGFIGITEERELTSATTLSFVLPRALEVRGTVIDARGEGVARATVECFAGRIPTTTSTGRDGQFVLAVPAGPSRLRASAGGHGASATLHVNATPAVPLEGLVLELRPSCDLAGRVLLPEGAPALGAWARIGGVDPLEWTEVGQDGVFRLADLPPGELSVRASVEGFADAWARVTLADGQTSTLELRLERSNPVRVSGRLLRAGQPYSGPLGFLSPRGALQATADAEGRYALELPAPGPWTAHVLAPEGDGRVLAGEFVLPASATHELTLELGELTLLASLDELPF